MADWTAEDELRTLVVSPKAAMAAELEAVLAREIPAARVLTLAEYPDHSALAELCAPPGLQLCFLEVASDPAQAARVLPLLARSAPGLPLVVLLEKNDSALVLQFLRLGAGEFMIAPFTADQLRAVLKKTVKSRVPAGGPGARVLSVMPGKPDSGATTLACNLAFALKRRGAGRVLLADLDGMTGTIAFQLKLKSTYSFVDALHHSGNLDPDVWKALVNHCNGVDVLLCPENPLDSVGLIWDPKPLLAYARANYDYVILDCGGTYGDWNLALARLASEVLLVTTTEIPVLHATQRAIAHLENAGADPETLRLVVNRHNPRTGLPTDSIETALAVDIFSLLPNEYEVIHRALIEGKPAPATSAYGKAVLDLSAKLMSEGATERKPCRHRGMLSQVR